MIPIMEFQERSLKGPVMKSTQFDLAFAKKVRELVGTYEIKYNPDELIVDDKTADAVFQAGVELLADVGLYHLDTQRVIQFSEEEIREVAKEYRENPPRQVFGQGEDEITVEYRTSDDKRPPILAGGAPGSIARGMVRPVRAVLHAGGDEQGHGNRRRDHGGGGCRAQGGHPERGVLWVVGVPDAPGGSRAGGQAGVAPGPVVYGEHRGRDHGLCGPRPAGTAQHPDWNPHRSGTEARLDTPVAGAVLRRQGHHALDQLHVHGGSPLPGWGRGGDRSRCEPAGTVELRSRDDEQPVLQPPGREVGGRGDAVGLQRGRSRIGAQHPCAHCRRVRRHGAGVEDRGGHVSGGCHGRVEHGEWILLTPGSPVIQVWRPAWWGKS